MPDTATDSKLCPKCGHHWPNARTHCSFKGCNCEGVLVVTDSNRPLVTLLERVSRMGRACEPPDSGYYLLPSYVMEDIRTALRGIA